MPTYKRIDKDTVKYWETYLNRMSSALVRDTDRYTLKLFILGLNEYLFTKATFWAFNNGDVSAVLRNQGGGLSQVKKYLSNADVKDKARKFADIADYIRHIPFQVKGNDVLFLRQASTDPDYLEIWETFIPKDTFVYRFLHDTKTLSAIQRELGGVNVPDSGLGGCINIARVCLMVDESVGESRYTVNETINKIVKDVGCSEKYAKDVVLRLIGDERRV